METAPGALTSSFQQEVSYHGPEIVLPPMTPVELVSPVVRHWQTRDPRTGRVRSSGLAIAVDSVEPLEAGTWPPEEYDRWLDEHWDDPAERKRLQYRENAIADPKRLPDRWIQACLWTITPHDVVDIRPA